MSTNRTTGPIRMTLRTPLSAGLLGGFLLLAGVVFAAVLFATGSGGAVGLAALLLVIFGGLGVLLLVIAAARARWARAYRRVHGHSPF
ncbi:MAG: hypothetical protein Q7T71_17375 [Herbiconiux sp.]|nr:hypothetical protein [Herbiconiux sp.]